MSIPGDGGYLFCKICWQTSVSILYQDNTGIWYTGFNVNIYIKVKISNERANRMVTENHSQIGDKKHVDSKLPCF
jgi:hypothetical protein